MTMIYFYFKEILNDFIMSYSPYRVSLNGRNIWIKIFEYRCEICKRKFLTDNKNHLNTSSVSVYNLKVGSGKKMCLINKQIYGYRIIKPHCILFVWQALFIWLLKINDLNITIQCSIITDMPKTQFGDFHFCARTAGSFLGLACGRICLT